MPNRRTPANASAAAPCPIISIGDAQRFPDATSTSALTPDEKPKWTPLYKVVDNSIRLDEDGPPNILPRKKLSTERKAEILERIRTGFYSDKQITTSVIHRMAEAI